MKLKFWQRQPRIPIETQTELIDLRAKVAEYAEQIAWLTDDKHIADNIRAFWMEKADGALEAGDD
jgi:hypothetical protein